MNTVLERKKKTFGTAANSKWSLFAVVVADVGLCAIWKYQAFYHSSVVLFQLQLLLSD